MLPSSKKTEFVAGIPIMLKNALDRFWFNDLDESYACACHYLIKKRTDGLAQSIIHALSMSKITLHTGVSAKKVLPPTSDAGVIKGWEILGPINVGKLEVDADPTFLSCDNQHDVALCILQMSSNTAVSTELMPGGTVSWNFVKVSKNGEVNTTTLFIFLMVNLSL